MFRWCYRLQAFLFQEQMDTRTGKGYSQPKSITVKTGRRYSVLAQPISVIAILPLHHAKRLTGVVFMFTPPS